MDALSIPNHPRRVLMAVAFAALCASASAHAQLGRNVAAMQASDGAVMHRAQSGLADYRETTDANGIVVREYVDASGRVYAISWRGPAMANVQTLLGDYFAPFRDSANASAGDAGLHATRIANGDLVVETQVRLREFSGRAWLASALPAGVPASDIQ